MVFVCLWIYGVEKKMDPDGLVCLGLAAWFELFTELMLAFFK